MTRRAMEGAVYLAGIFVFALGYEPLKRALGGRFLFLGLTLVYLLSLRLLGTWMARRWATP